MRACIQGTRKYALPCFAIIGAENPELAYGVDGTIPTFIIGSQTIF